MAHPRIKRARRYQLQPLHHSQITKTSDKMVRFLAVLLLLVTQKPLVPISLGFADALASSNCSFEQTKMQTIAPLDLQNLRELLWG